MKLRRGPSKLQFLTFNLYFFPISCNFLHKDSVTSGSVLSSSVFVNLERRSFAYVPPGKGKPLLGTDSTPHTRFRVAEPSTLKCGLSVPRASRRRYFPAFLFTNPFRITTYARTSGGMVSSLRKLVLTITHLCILLPTCSTAQTHVPPQSSDQGEALLTAAKSLFQQSKFTEADRAVRQYLETHPNSADGHFLLGHILFREIQAQAVEAQFPPQTHGPVASARTMAAISSNASVPKDAQEMAKASLAEFTAGAKYRTPSAADLKIVALDYVLLVDYPDADKWLTKMLEWAPDDSEGWYYLGRTKYNENRFAEAIRAFQQCLKLDPQNVKAEDNLGLSLAGLGRNEEAATAYNQAIAWQAQLLTRNPGPYIDLGSLLIDENRAQDAVRFLLQAIEIAPRDSRAHELLGKAYTRVEEFPKAQVELERAVEISPQAPNLHCMLAPLYHKQGLGDKAKAEYDRCAALTGTHSVPETPRQ